jgi:hypothetical protein
VKKCRICKKRFVVPKALAKRYFCDDCQKKVDKEGLPQIED